MIMVMINIPERTARNILYCLNEVFDNSSSSTFNKEIIEDKMRIKRAIGRAKGIPRNMLTDYRLKNMVKN